MKTKDMLPISHPSNYLRFGTNKLQPKRTVVVPDSGEYHATNRSRCHLPYPKNWTEPSKLKGTSILDLCCGNEGAFVESLLSEDGINAFGIDYDEEHLKVFKPKNCIAGDVRALPFPDKSFDIIYCSNGTLTFGNDDDIIKTLFECHRVLKPGGRVRCAPINPHRIPKIIQQNHIPFTIQHPKDFITAIELTKQ